MYRLASILARDTWGQLVLGTPVIHMGNEVQRTQHGSNNIYCRWLSMAQEHKPYPL
jgi:pullulanase/glycogen debranching enzyme